MKINTHELQGAALDWAVAKCAGVRTKYDPREGLVISNVIGWLRYSPSLDWGQGGPIIERLQVQRLGMTVNNEWVCKMPLYCIGYGPTPLIAAMRCYVVREQGTSIDIPDEIPNETH